MSHWTKTGRLVLVDGKVDIARSDALLMTSLDARRGGAEGGPLRWAEAIRTSALTSEQIEHLIRVAMRAAVSALIGELNTKCAGGPVERR